MRKPITVAEKARIVEEARIDGQRRIKAFAEELTLLMDKHRVQFLIKGQFRGEQVISELEIVAL